MHFLTLSASEQSAIFSFRGDARTWKQAKKSVPQDTQASEGQFLSIA